MTSSDVMFRDPQDPVLFGQSFLSSDGFRALFAEGMALVEASAAYLDGPGREDSRILGRPAALAYASESMRLTTRLMQIASWLLVQRAVAEGEISPSQALAEKHRVRLSSAEPAASLEADALPERLRDLIGQSLRLHARIRHLDGLITNADPAPRDRTSPVAVQQGLLRTMFGRTG
jgi:regulator of CtrA degradation